MPCSPQDLLNFSKKLSNSDEEVELRASISRAYYSAFHLADNSKEICLPIHRDTVSGGSHQFLIKRYLDIKSHTKARQIGYVLQDMCTRRESADYKLNEVCDNSHASSQIASAVRVGRLLNELEVELSNKK